MIISYEPILTKIALPEIPGIKKNENATKPLKNIKGILSMDWIFINPIKNPNNPPSKNKKTFL